MAVADASHKTDTLNGVVDKVLGQPTTTHESERDLALKATVSQLQKVNSNIKSLKAESASTKITKRSELKEWKKIRPTSHA